MSGERRYKRSIASDTMIFSFICIALFGLYLGYKIGKYRSGWSLRRDAADGGTFIDGAFYILRPDDLDTRVAKRLAHPVPPPVNGC